MMIRLHISRKGSCQEALVTPCFWLLRYYVSRHVRVFYYCSIDSFVYCLREDLETTEKEQETGQDYALNQSQQLWD
jgi:hypothetical protein